jgi:hypothetical protein
MASVCWLEDRDDRLARARALAEADPAAALALVAQVLAEVPADREALCAKGAILVDVADRERDPARARSVYDEALALLEAHGGERRDLEAARRGRETTSGARRTG